jgi:hypothetical protein
MDEPRPYELKITPGSVYKWAWQVRDPEGKIIQKGYSDVLWYARWVAKRALKQAIKTGFRNGEARYYLDRKGRWVRANG